MLEEQFQTIKNSFSRGVVFNGIDFRINRYDIWPESDKEKLTVCGVFRNDVYEKVTDASTPEMAIRLLKQLCLTLEVEANKPDIETHWRLLPDGSKVSSHSLRNKHIDEIIKKRIIEPAQKDITRLEILCELIKISPLIDTPEDIKTTDTNPSKSNDTSEIPDEIKNIFNPLMSLDEVKRWFMQLATNNSTNGNSFLTVKQVEQFIERAFIGNANVQKLTFNMAKGERNSIAKLFYLYFDRCRNDHAIEATRQCKERYVKLLTNNFTNYNYGPVFDNWNHYKDAPKQWDITI